MYFRVFEMEKVKFGRRLKGVCLIARKFYDICDLQYFYKPVFRLYLVPG